MRLIMYKKPGCWYLSCVNKVILARSRNVTGRLGVRRDYVKTNSI